MAKDGRPDRPRPVVRGEGLLADLPAAFCVDAVDFTAEPFTRLTYAYPGRRPARLALGRLPAPMRAELLFWLHSLHVGGERVNSWALVEWVRVAGGLSIGADPVGSFVELSVEQWLAAARRRYYDRHQRMPPASYGHNHRATISRLHAAVARAYHTGEWWRAEVWDPCHDPRIPLREHEPLRTARLQFGRVDPVWLRRAIQWYFAVNLGTGALCWTSLPGYLTYLGVHFGGFLTAAGVDDPRLVADPGSQLRGLAVAFLHHLRQRRSASGRPLAPATIGISQSALAGFYTFLVERREEAAAALGDPRWAGLTDAHARWWRAGELARGPRGGGEANYIEPAVVARIVEHADILGLPADRTKTVLVAGQPRVVSGFGDEQAMRALLLAVATGRRINEILLMDYQPLQPVPGLDTDPTRTEGGFVARLRYQQTKIRAATDTILIDAYVVGLIHEQQDFTRARLAAAGHTSPPRYLFLARQSNQDGARPYSANTLHGLLSRLAAQLDLRDSTGRLVDFQRTHRFRHTKATELLNAGVPIHVVQRYMGHCSPEMAMHYAATLAETHEREFLRFAKHGRDGRPVPLDPADVYDLVQLDRHTDRILPNGVCLLPPPKRCDRGNACLTCDQFATDARHLAELRAQLAGTDALIEQRQAQHQHRTGTPMSPDNIWLAERLAERRSLQAIIAALEASPPATPTAVRGAGTTARRTQPVFVELHRPADQPQP
jgi:integrase